jgi:hypothetical protein
MKKWYLSKTLWANFIAFIVLLAQKITGEEIISLEVQTQLIILINFALRLITKQELQ